MKLKLLSVLSSEVNGLGQRILKAWNGKSDTRTAKGYGPFGTDSNPPKGTVAVYAKTEVDGREVFLCYLNKNQLAAVGDNRLFSTDSNGGFKFNVWLRSDGTALMGDSDVPADYTNFAVLFNELKTEFNAMKSTLNNHISDYNTHTHPVPGVTVGLGSTTSSATLSTSSPDTSNIDNAKNTKIKYPA